MERLKRERTRKKYKGEEHFVIDVVLLQSCSDFLSCWNPQYLQGTLHHVSIAICTTFSFQRHFRYTSLNTQCPMSLCLVFKYKWVGKYLYLFLELRDLSFLSFQSVFQVCLPLLLELVLRLQRVVCILQETNTMRSGI